MRRRVRARIEGTVQGVGFRPFVFRLAERLMLAGFVLNDERGVLLEIEGDGESVELFFEGIADEMPALATIEGVRREELQPTGESGFQILESDARGESQTQVAPDTATCEECLAELQNPADRRFRYPFINCTNCGPRFSIISDTPYDRQFTTMSGFEMCDLCASEYHDPGNRRFHAEPNACGDCGPVVRFVDASGFLVPLKGAVDGVQAAARALTAGAVVAVKGVGGFHLACVASAETAVSALRSRKHREDKAFAVMAPHIESAGRLVRLGPEEIALITSRARPIVLGTRVAGASVAPAVAPRSPDLGVMLPYSALHHLLLEEVGVPLIMTSGNRSDEPIAYDDTDALARLAGIADFFLLHNRPIHVRTDDSVTRVVVLGNVRKSVVLRRSRGYVPGKLDLPVESPHLVACGAELKNTFCVARGRSAWVGPHVGDLRNYETLQSFHEGVGHFERLFSVNAEVVVHDLHPDYMSTSYALDRAGVDLVGVQHHHAHLAACLAEHGETGPAVGAIFDGSGYGLDGTVWGGEILFGGLTGFERAAHLWPVRLPGGDRAVREPWRMACAWLVESTGVERPAIPRALAGKIDPDLWENVCRLVQTGFSAPVTTSVGRLFDAVAALCGVAVSINYEGQAAVELEALSHVRETGSYDMSPISAATGAIGGGLVIDAREMVNAVTHDIEAGVDPAIVSARFHNGLSSVTARVCAIVAEERGCSIVVLSGGVFQNSRLLEATSAHLTESGLSVLTPALLPPNDGGISYGQAAVAAALYHR